MRGISKYTHPVIEEGSTRMMRVFAYLPIEVGGYRIWLEHYEVLQGWIIERFKLKVDGQDKAFEVGKWVDISKRIMN